MKYAKQLINKYQAFEVDKEYWENKAEEMVKALEEIASDGYRTITSNFGINEKEFDYLRYYFSQFGYTFEKNNEDYVLSFPTS